MTICAIQRRRDENSQARQHADGRQSEAPSPTVGFADDAAQQRRDGRAEIDAHVEDRETAVAFARKVAVEDADHVRDVRLEETVADDENPKSRVEEERSWRTSRQSEPVAISNPPTITARREPSSRSASIPPKNGIM